ncbi:prolyl oligopeptidase family serine peptidase [Roseimaritima sediminicola]|uniref:prolyl oligopeptidase family serine peptidase n=1 Tax=Roseimaritima sediminicola TaxID=2662066 RepID=UPI00129836F5|nr:prolyl oligopeptidase family serine peptidase [Roseimaritima sediminicola]
MQPTDPRRCSPLWLLATLLLCFALTPLKAFCQDVRTADYKALPAAGKAPPPEQAERLRERIAGLRQAYQHAGLAASDTADVEVLVRAVDLALEQNLFYNDRDIAAAEKLLDRAARRLEKLRAGRRGIALLEVPDSPADEPVPLVGGFVSQIDDSVQPYGLVLPAGWKAGDGKPRRLDVWLHGRGDSKVELQFIHARLQSTSPITPPETIVLHPFGRHCNAFKFAGEVDVYEAIEHVAERFAVDPDSISIRGFSMGGAGCWQFAVHDPGRWFAANPGAGFADTVRYQGWNRQPAYTLSGAQRLLLAWYDCPPWAGNLQNTRVIAYSGERDKQKLAADTMAEASRAHGLQWTHVIGKDMGHKIDEPSAEIMQQQLQQWAAEPAPAVPEVDFTTYTLRYPRCDWLTIEGIERHWHRARIQGRVQPNRIVLKTDACTHLAIDLPADVLSATPDAITIEIDGEALVAPDAVAGQPYHCDLIRLDEGWAIASEPDRSLRKRPGLQGPIDDALTGRFVFVRPSRPCWHGRVERWVQDEYRYAKQRWRSIMRGEIREVSDRELDEATIADSNLILFGDPHANAVLAGLVDRLPLHWDRDSLQIAGERFDAADHAAVMVYPNPLNPDRYIVLNSGLTFREFSNVSNSRQIPMLPDWAILDITEGSNALLPGNVAAEGFFDERWEVKGEE